jgi:VWFA-related protein
MKKYTFTGLALFLCVSRLAVAQLEMQPPPDNRATTVTSVMMDMPEGVIKLDVLVTDATGNPISGLSADDFGLLENGHLQNVLSFRAFDGRGGSTEPPVKIIILIDTVALPESLAREERLAVTSYLRRNGGRLEHPFSVFWLADSGLWTVAPSEDGNVLAREIERSNFTLVRHNAGWQSSSPLQGLKDSPSESALKALGLIACDERKKPGRKLLLWVGPGWGVGSGGYAEKVQGSPPPFNTVWWFSALLREAHLALYSFTVGETDPHAQLYKAYLAGVSEPRKASFMNVYRKVLAVQSGGRVVDDGFDLVGEIESCIRDAGPFYRISFDPLAADHPNEYHDLKVVVKRQELTARTNTGYYDQPYYSIDPIPPTQARIDRTTGAVVGRGARRTG